MPVHSKITDLIGKTPLLELGGHYYKNNFKLTGQDKLLPSIDLSTW